MITAPITAMILIVVGYDLTFHKDTLKESLKTIGLRIAIQTVMIALCVWFGGKTLRLDRKMLYAIVIYMSAPPAFSVQSLVKNEKGAAYASTTISLFCAISIAVFAVCTFLIH